MSESFYNIESRIKTAVGQQRISFNENSWLKMEALLDEEDMDFAVINIFNKAAIPGVGNNKNKIIPASLLLLLLAFITGTVAIHVSKPVTRSPGTGIGKMAGSADHNQDRSLVKMIRPESVGEDEVTLSTLQSAAFPARRPVSGQKESIGNKRTTIPIDTKIMADTIGSFLAAGKQQLPRASSPLLADQSLMASLIIVEKDSLTAGTAASSGHAKKDDTSTIKTAEKSETQKQLSKNNFLKNIGFYVAVAPEVNSVGFKEASPITVSYAAGFSYDIGKNFSLHTGFTIANKIYKTDREGYHPPQGSIFLPLDTLEVSAVCKVLDIPINLRYYFSNNQKHNFFISTGVSSYLMKKEKYDFIYFEQGVYKTRQGNFKNRNNHLLANLNISAGCSRNINQKLSLHIEPYVKLPLQGVGMGKVKLTSTGFFFRAGFRPW